MIFDDPEFAGLPRSDKAVNGITELRKFFLQSFVNKRLKIKRSICGIFQKLIRYRLCRFAEGVRDNVSQLDIGNRETVLQMILSTDSLNIFGMGKDNRTILFEVVINRDPVFTGGSRKK